MTAVMKRTFTRQLLNHPSDPTTEVEGAPGGRTVGLRALSSGGITDVEKMAEKLDDEARYVASPEALKAKLESEIARWKPVIEAAGVYAD